VEIAGALCDACQKDMPGANTEIDRLRRQVIRELSELPLTPWRPRRLTRRQRAARVAAIAWRRSVALARRRG
jgi:hypothetical protein